MGKHTARKGPYQRIDSLVLESGRIIERGSHKELMERGGAYCRMVELQKQSTGWNQEVRA